MGLRVRVTEADLDSGTPGDSRKCPVALAVSRGYGINGMRVDVGTVHAFHTGLRGECFWQDKLPADVVEKVRMIDRGDVVEPFEFELKTGLESMVRVWKRNLKS